MLEIIWAESVWDAFEDLPSREQVPILKVLGILPLFPKMYPSAAEVTLQAAATSWPGIGLCIIVLREMRFGSGVFTQLAPDRFNSTEARDRLWFAGNRG